MRERLGTRARDLRNSGTEAERLPWRHLRNSQLEGLKFRRQHAIEGFIADFASFTPKLIIELDGSQHQGEADCDDRRDNCLRSNGFTSQTLKQYLKFFASISWK